MENDLHDARELTRKFTTPSRTDTTPPSDAALAEWVAALTDGFKTHAEIGPVPDNWRSAEWFFENTDHPFARRFGRQRAAAQLRDVSVHHSHVITPEILDRMHVALFDVCAAVAEDITIALGILGRTKSREPLERFTAMMAAHSGWQTNVTLSRWALLRVTDPTSVAPSRGTGEEPVIAIQTLGPDTVWLVQRGDHLVLLNPETGAEVGVSRLEAKLFASTPTARLHEFFQNAGGLDELGSDASRLGAVALGLSHGLPHADALTTLTDTSTLAMAQLAVGGYPSPEALLDLSVLVHCCVFYDAVLVDAVDPDVPSELEGVIVPVAPYEAKIVDPRWEIAVARARELEVDFTLRKEVESAWESMLGRHVPIDFLSFDSITTSPGVGRYFPAGGTIGFFDPLESEGVRGSQAENELVQAVSVQTFRYWINEKVAETLGTAYNCTSLRYPIENIALARRSAYRTSPELLLEGLAPAAGHVLGRPAESGLLDEIQMPHPLSIVLARAKAPDDIWSEVARLREKFAPVRDALRRARRTGVPDGIAVNKLLRQLSREEKSAQLVNTTLAVASTVAASTMVGADGGTMMLKAAATAKPGAHFARLAERVLRPEIYVLRTFAADVAQLRNQAGVIEGIWGMRPDRKWLTRASALSASSAHAAGRYRQQTPGS